MVSYVLFRPLGGVLCLVKLKIQYRHPSIRAHKTNYIHYSLFSIARFYICGLSYTPDHTHIIDSD